MVHNRTNNLVMDTHRVFLVLELEQQLGDKPSINIVASLPGRDGTLVKRWPTVQGRVTASQAQDMATWADQCVMNALTTWTGLQGVLPME